MSYSPEIASMSRLVVAITGRAIVVTKTRGIGTSDRGDGSSKNVYRYPLFRDGSNHCKIAQKQRSDGKNGKHGQKRDVPMHKQNNPW